MNNPAAFEVINASVRARYGDRTGSIPEERVSDAHGYGRALREQANKLGLAVDTVNSMSGEGTVHRELLIGQLLTLHSVELDRLASAVAQAVARKDPSRLDGRFTDLLQNYADRFR